MQTMYEAMVNSPITRLSSSIDGTQTTITIENGSKLPDAPNLAVIGIGEDAETILYGVKEGNVLSSVTRGFQGMAKPWDANKTIARFFTAHDHDSMKENVTEIDGKVVSHLEASMPHQYTAEGITYRWGIAEQDGVLGIIREVVE